ncbi:cell filamentation protein Fic [Paenibacillus sp. MY03]|jgi:Fic family protein|uniref:Fic family protein n=1 Tax=Paenibacillus sp. MY03 TaxID=302980 RepID=UPI000B3D28C0|nr:Fic family protein [Paenibacillus sp. MY03]OUS76161.1 cell filamentation protein Fic [Paenibacillus sp. MY03]
MKYEKLTKLYYKLDQEAFNMELNKRKDGYGSYHTSLMIKGFRKGQQTKETFELFYVNINSLMNLNNQVLLNSSTISLLINKLPDFVVQPYFDKLIINEAQSNNEIEGIRSTKKELEEALSEAEKSEPKNKRFKGLMKTYRYIDQIGSFESVQDFRSLYDDLVADEIKIDDIPDGELFRKGHVEISDGFSTTHIGVRSEENIIEGLASLLNYLQDESHPPLYRFMVAHYYYEYIHPFYDGNGRTGRLIVGSYLSRYLEKYSAITFSYAVNRDKSKYYKALEEIAAPLNHGDMTFYLVHMLELLSSGQNGIIEDLEINLMKLERIKEYIKNDKWDNYRDEKYFLYLIVSINVFIAENMILSIQDLMGLSKKSRHITNKVMDFLEQEGYVELVSKKPKSYKICDGCIEKILAY